MLKGTYFLEKQVKIAIMSNSLLRSSNLKKGLKILQSDLTPRNYFNHSYIPSYSGTKHLPLPSNLKDLDCTEKLQFSPHRNKDINGLFIASYTSPFIRTTKSDIESHVDERIECYDCSGTINLSSVMQTNVPFPFIRGKPVHLNMPGGHWGHKEKYVAEALNNVHYSNARNLQQYTGGSYDISRKTGIKNSYISFPVSDQFGNNLSSTFSMNNYQIRGYSTDNQKVDIRENLDEKNSTPKVPQLSNKEKLKAAVKDYGAVVIVFHVTISLVSLGCCYALIASGFDPSTIFKSFGADEGAAAAGNAARFVIAYTVHKTLAPGRIAITLAAVPFIVKKLRKIGYLKPPKTKSQ